MSITYYIDPQSGCDTNNGRSPQTPLKSLEAAALKPGDTALFRRGCLITRSLKLIAGDPDAPITYGAYGEGENPVIDNSVDASDPALWQHEDGLLWRYIGSLPSEVCNIIFDGGQSFGNLRWSKEELDEPDEWFYTDIGLSTSRDCIAHPANQGTLWLCAKQNPALEHASVRIAVWGSRREVYAASNVVFEDFTLQNIGLHGFQGEFLSNVTVRRCRFLNLGGAVWDRELKIRFGNAVEFWNGASDCVVEHCTFVNIYDAGVTHQGDVRYSKQAERLYYRNNVFCRCGLAAYEWRGPSSQDVYFENNICIEPGGAFTLQGEPAPRRCEKELVGATCTGVAIWRLETTISPDATYCTIRNNVFCNIPDYGMAIASVIDPKHERQFVIDNNLYLHEGESPFLRFDGRTFDAKAFELYKTLTGQDKNSTLMGC